MNRYRTIAGLCLLSALALCAFAAQSASAAPSTTWFTCSANASTRDFSDAHCATPAAPQSNFGHVAINADVTTEAIVTNSETCGGTTTACVFKVKTVSSGVGLEMQFKKLSGAGSLHNHLTGTTHEGTGTVSITLEEGTVTAPAGKGCEIEGGKIVTNELALKTEGMGIKLQAKTGTVIAAYKIKGCTQAALNKEYKLEGSITGTPNGATLGFTHAGITEQGTLTIGGQKAGVEGQCTYKARANASELYNALVTTTVTE